MTTKLHAWGGRDLVQLASWTSIGPIIQLWVGPTGLPSSPSTCTGSNEAKGPMGLKMVRYPKGLFDNLLTQ